MTPNVGGRPKGAIQGRYEECRAEDVPENVRFTVPRANQGQIIEVAYGSFGRGEGAHGDPYKRVTNRAIAKGEPGWVRYYQLDSKASG